MDDCAKNCLNNILTLFICFFSVALHAVEQDNIVKSVNTVAQFNKKVPYEIMLGDTGEVEFKIIHKMGFVLVEVSMDSSDPILMLLDTGADASILSNKAVKTLKLKPIEESQQKVITGANKTHIDTALYLIEDVRIGEAHIKNAPFIVSSTAADDFELLADLGVEGIIGANLFHDIVITLDLGNSKVRLSKNYKAQKGYRIPLDKNYYLPVIKSKVVQGKKSTEYNLLIDTGYTGYVKMPICFSDTQRGTKKVMTYDVFNQSQAGFISELDGNLEIGDKVLESPRVKFTIGNCEDAPPWGLIGSGYLKYQVMSIDQRNREVIVH